MHPPICKTIGNLIYKNHRFNYVYDYGLNCDDNLCDYETSEKLEKFLKKYYKNCEVQKLGIAVLLDLSFEYQIKGNILYLNGIYLKCDNNRFLKINKKVNWIKKMTIKTPLKYKTFFYFKNAKLIKIKKTKQECFNTISKAIMRYFS